MFWKLGSHLLVNDVKSESVSSPLHLGDQVADGLDALNLLAQVLGLEEVAQETGALVPGHLVDVEEALVDRLLKLERGLLVRLLLEVICETMESLVVAVEEGAHREI